MRFVPLSALGGARLLAFAGIGSPAGFRRTLAEAAVSVADFQEFADHHWYSREDLARLEGPRRGRRRRRIGHDREGLGPPAPPASARRPLYVLSVRLCSPPASRRWRAAFARLGRAMNHRHRRAAAQLARRHRDGGPGARRLRAAWPEARVVAAGPWASLLARQGLADVLLDYPRPWSGRLRAADAVPTFAPEPGASCCRTRSRRRWPPGTGAPGDGWDSRAVAARRCSPTPCPCRAAPPPDR